jgi:hypothetical protein
MQLSGALCSRSRIVGAHGGRNIMLRHVAQLRVLAALVSIGLICGRWRPRSSRRLDGCGMSAVGSEGGLTGTAAAWRTCAPANVLAMSKNRVQMIAVGRPRSRANVTRRPSQDHETEREPRPRASGFPRRLGRGDTPRACCDHVIGRRGEPHAWPTSRASQALGMVRAPSSARLHGGGRAALRTLHPADVGARGSAQEVSFDSRPL